MSKHARAELVNDGLIVSCVVGEALVDEIVHLSLHFRVEELRVELKVAEVGLLHLHVTQLLLGLDELLHRLSWLVDGAVVLRQHTVHLLFEPLLVLVEASAIWLVTAAWKIPLLTQE